MTFAGESRQIDNAADLTGGTADYSLAYEIVYRGAYDDAHGSSRALSGGEWVVWVRPFYDYLEPGDDAVLSWVVEVESGSGSVTVSAGEGLDPDSTDPFRPADTALGTFTLSAGTNVIPSQITAATLIATTDDLMLRLSPVSGSAVVSQVKLRVWPPGGAVGGWATGDPFDVTVSWSKRRVSSASSVSVGATSSDPEAAWDAGATALLADAGATPWRQVGSYTTATDIPAEADASLGVGIIDFAPTYGSDGTATLVASVIAQPDPDPVALSSYLSHTDGGIRPPDEVPGDPAQLTYASGSPSVAWGGDLTVSSYYNIVQPNGFFGSAALIVSDVSSVGYSSDYLANLTSLTIPLSGSGGPLAVGSSQTFAMPAGATAAMVAVSHPLLLSVPPFAGVPSEFGGHVIVSGSLPDSVVTVPAFTYWSPSGTTPEPMRLMQRGDGLGMGSGRVIGAGTRQASSRVFGSY